MQEQSSPVRSRLQNPMPDSRPKKRVRFADEEPASHPRPVKRVRFALKVSPSDAFSQKRIGLGWEGPGSASYARQLRSLGLTGQERPYYARPFKPARIAKEESASCSRSVKRIRSVEDLEEWPASYECSHIRFAYPDGSIRTECSASLEEHMPSLGHIDRSSSDNSNKVLSEAEERSAPHARPSNGEEKEFDDQAEAQLQSELCKSMEVMNQQIAEDQRSVSTPISPYLTPNKAYTNIAYILRYPYRRHWNPITQDNSVTHM